MNNLINQNNYYFNMMTNEQAYLLDYLEEQTTAVIQGEQVQENYACGGKSSTIISEWRKVLFLCFNSLLIQSLQQKYKNELSNVYFSNLNSIVSKALNKKQTMMILFNSYVI